MEPTDDVRAEVVTDDCVEEFIHSVGSAAGSENYQELADKFGSLARAAKGGNELAADFLTFIVEYVQGGYEDFANMGDEVVEEEETGEVETGEEVEAAGASEEDPNWEEA